MSNLTNFATLAVRAWVPQVIPVRFRYFADKKRCIRRWGYQDPINQKGLLAHSDKERPLIQMPIYRPDDSWAEKKALFGQNDYIDILGSDELKVSKLAYNVPRWLRGVRGNELQVLIKKKKALSRGIFPLARPTKWKELNKRIIWLWKFLNRKTKTSTSKQ
ncbi:hypothetical protein QAD02_022328 [Eretmocerus hayati]|uniref:Uncharacterized protein n=1 Tax=Eretmocerus hayati TaxID=131215 RepID=A0ACC2PTA0_9HYME|nr:hypothetical protein QAD02_022328 [Eretmocerus hayati]